MNQEKNCIEKIKETTRELRLLYYNNYLLKKGIISKKDFEKMNLAIISKE